MEKTWNINVMRENHVQKDSNQANWMQKFVNEIREWRIIKVEIGSAAKSTRRRAHEDKTGAADIKR